MTEPPAAPLRGPRFLDAGDTALVVEFGSTVDPAISDRVLALDAALVAMKIPGVRETVPTYRSLMIHYEPLVVDRASLIETAEKIAEQFRGGIDPANRWTIPCCYEPPYGEDTAKVAQKLGLTADEVVKLHHQGGYRVYMYGFAPGFCFLGGLDKRLGVPRRASPRSPHPARVIMIAGGLAQVATFSMPTGWWVIGRTPERMFCPTRDPIVLAEIGDQLRFEPVDRHTFESLDRRAEAGEIVARRERLR